MEKISLSWTEDTSDPLVEVLRIVDAAANTVVVGTGRFSAGQSMPETGFSQHPMREISIVVEGEIETQSGGKTVRLRTGDLVTIPPQQIQHSRFLADTRLIYIFFGHRPSRCEDDC